MDEKAIREMKEKANELWKNSLRQDELTKRGKLILRNQSQVLCKALQQLKRRGELGHKLAGEIWNSMIDGITNELPLSFFEEHSRAYFWEHQDELTEDEKAFKQLLDQALTRQKEKEEEEKNKLVKGKRNSSPIPGSSRSQAQNLKCGADGHVCLFEGTTPILGTPRKMMKEVRRKERLEDMKEKKEETKDEDALLINLINVIKVAIERTEDKRWDWKEEDLELKNEIQIFHQGLKVAMQLFEEVYHNPNLESLIQAIEKISGGSSTPARRSDIVVDEKQEGAAAAARPSSPVCTCTPSSSSGSASRKTSSSSDSKFPETGDDEGDETEDYDEEDYRDDEDYDDYEEEEDFVTEEYKRSTCVAGPSCGKVQVVDQHFIVRQFKSEEGKMKRRPMAFKCTPCDHIGCNTPPAHARDWKREGLYCNCGKKFATTKEMDRHLAYSSESLVLCCPKCEFQSNRRCCMEKHKRDMHDKLEMMKSSRRLYKCRMGCGEVYESKREMQLHLKETGRQCTKKNAGKLPLKMIPANPLVFISMLKGTLNRAGLEMTPDRLDAVLRATKKDRKKEEKNLKLLQGITDAVTDEDSEDEDDDEDRECVKHVTVKDLHEHCGMHMQ